MRKICLKIHKWLALPFGLFMAILCFTGFLIIALKDLSLLLGMEESVKPFLSSVTRLHRWLFMKPDNPHGGLSVGRVVMAISSMCMVLVLLTGVVVWWPKSKKMLKSRLKVSTSKGFRRFVYDTHVSLGIYVFVFLFLMALTGPVFSFGWYRQGMSKLFGQNTEKMENKMPKGGDKPVATKQNAFAHDNMERTTEHAQRQEGGAPEPPKDGKDKKPGGKKLFKSLHTGKWAGWFSRLLYALAALVGGFLPISGYYLWWKKRQGKHAK